MQQQIAAIGGRLRALRHARNLTLEQLSERAEISVSTLSRLESGKRQASLELLLPITRQLGVTIDDLLPRDEADPRVKRPVLQKAGLVIAPLTPKHSTTNAYKITYPPTANLPEQRVHDGYEWFYVLSGKIRLRLGSQDLVLVKGEAAEFDTQVPHSITAHGAKPAQVISIFNEAGMRIHTHVNGDEVSSDRV